MAEFSIKGPTVTTSYSTDKSGKVVQVGKPVYSSGSSSTPTPQPQASTANNASLQSTSTTTTPSQDYSWAMSRPTQSLQQPQANFGALTFTAPPVETQREKTMQGAFEQTQLYKNIKARQESSSIGSFSQALSGNIIPQGATLSGAVSELVTFGATSSFPELRPAQASAAVRLVDVRASLGEQTQFGKNVATAQQTGFIFDTGSFFKPRTEVVAQSISKGITTGNVLKEVGIVRISSEGERAQLVGRASTTVFSPTSFASKFYTLGEFYSKSGKTITSSPFSSIGMEVGRVGELKQYNILTAQEARGLPYISAERMTQIARIPEGQLTRTRYASIGAGTSGPGIEMPSIIKVGREAVLTKPLTEVTGPLTDLKLISAEPKTIQLQTPIANIERMAARSGMKTIQLERGIFTATQAVAGLSRTSLSQIFSFKSFQEQAISQGARTGFNLGQLATPGTAQLFQFVLMPPSTPGFGIPATGPPAAAPPFIPPVIPFGGPGFDLGFRRPKFSGFGATAARYIPNLRGLESGRIASRTTGIFTGAEVRGITKDMAKALGYNIKTKRRK